MKIKLSEKQTRVILACLEEIQMANYWRISGSPTEWAGLSDNGRKDIDKLLEYFAKELELSSDDEYERIFVDFDCAPVTNCCDDQ